jgi:hypothetical protein
MKKNTHKTTKNGQIKKSRIQTRPMERSWPQTINSKEKSIDSIKLDHDIPEDYREASGNEIDKNQANITNWSQAEDRGEDLINERDPFIQQPERDTEIPPELIQERAYKLYEQRGNNPGDNLSDWFNAERQLRKEIGKQKLKE